MPSRVPSLTVGADLDVDQQKTTLTSLDSAPTAISANLSITSPAYHRTSSGSSCETAIGRLSTISGATRPALADTVPFSQEKHTPCSRLMNKYNISAGLTTPMKTYSKLQTIRQESATEGGKPPLEFPDSNNATPNRGRIENTGRILMEHGESIHT